MTQVMKHVFKFGEQRRTLYLNLHNKDEYGRHRGHVLYGMRIIPSGISNPRQITIRPGAVYTPYGTRFYFDVTAPATPGLNTIDLTNILFNGHGVFDALNNANRPIVVAIFMRFVNDAGHSRAVESESDLGTLSCKFDARPVTWNRVNVGPDLNLEPLNPVDMDVPQSTSQFAGDFIKTVDTNASVPPLGVPPDDGALDVNEMLLGYVIIGCKADGTFPTTVFDGSSPTAPWTEGVSMIQARNGWEAISDFIGQDVLLGRNPVDVTGPMDTSLPNGTALLQQPGRRHIGDGSSSAVAPLMRSPRFGTPAPGGGDDPWDVSWDSYRLPSFLKDGDSLVWVMRRLDYVLRLWMDRTGDHSLIDLIQDGTGAGLSFMSPLDEILNAFRGDDVNNLNVINYPDVGQGSTNNFALKSGFVSHDDLGQATIGTPYADTHLAGIKTLDAAVWMILTRIFGETIVQATMRVASDPSSLVTWAETPQDGRNLVTGAVSGAIAKPYLTNEKYHAALAEVIKRSMSGPGENWLRNHAFWAGDAASGTQATPPAFWAFGGSAGTGTWTRTIETQGIKQLRSITIALDPNSDLEQVIVSANPIIGQMLESGDLVSLSAVIKATGSQSIEILFEGYSDLAMTAQVFSAKSAPITLAQGLLNTSVCGRVTAATTVRAVVIRIRSSTAAASCAAQIYGVAFNVGIPSANPIGDTAPDNWLSRDGGDVAKMRGDLHHGGFQAKHLGLAALGDDAPRVDQALTVVDLSDTASAWDGRAKQLTNIGAADSNDDAPRVDQTLHLEDLSDAAGPYSALTKRIQHLGAADSSDDALRADQGLRVIGYNPASHFDALGKRVTNSADAVDPLDLVTKQQAFLAGSTVAQVVNNNLNITPRYNLHGATLDVTTAEMALKVSRSVASAWQEQYPTSIRAFAYSEPSHSSSGGCGHQWASSSVTDNGDGTWHLHLAASSPGSAALGGDYGNWSSGTANTTGSASVPADGAWHMVGQATGCNKMAAFGGNINLMAKIRVDGGGTIYLSFRIQCGNDGDGDAYGAAGFDLHGGIIAYGVV